MGCSNETPQQPLESKAQCPRRPPIARDIGPFFVPFDQRILLCALLGFELSSSLSSPSETTMHNDQGDAVAAWRLQLISLATFAMHPVAIHHATKACWSFAVACRDQLMLIDNSARLQTPTQSRQKSIGTKVISLEELQHPSWRTSQYPLMLQLSR